MKLGLKLPLAFATALLLAACAGFFGIYSLNQSLTVYGTTVQVDAANERAVAEMLVWTLLGLGVVFFFWRAIWGLAVLGGVLAVLVYVWANPGYSDSAKLIASGIAIAAGSLLFPKKVSLLCARNRVVDWNRSQPAP